MSVAPMPLRRRWRPRTLAGKAGVVGVAAVVVLAAAWWAADAATSRRLAAAWAVSEKRFGLANEVVGLFGPALSAGENATVPFREAVQRAKKQCLLGKVMPRDEKASLDPDKMTAPEQMLEDSAYEGALFEADRRGIFHMMGDLSAPLRLADTSYVPDVRYCTVAEISSARWLAAHGRRDDAVLRLVRYARLIRKWGGTEPSIFAGMFLSATEISVFMELNKHLRRPGRLAASTHDEVEKEAAAIQEDVLRAFLAAMQSEKIMMAEEYDAQSPHQGTVLLRPWRNLDKLYLLHSFNRSMETLTLPAGESEAAQKEFMEREGLSSKNALHRLVYPMSTQLGSPSILHRQRPCVMVLARCLRIVNAMACKGDFEVPLERLGLPTDCLTDPFDGRPMRVKKTAAGPIFYSIGPNLQDDGGALGAPRDKFDLGLGPEPTATEKAP